jgi:predicted protein tyrosine phosphatase
MFPPFEDRPAGAYATCPVCKGGGRDPKKRKRVCPGCSGSGQDRRHCGKCHKEILDGDMFDSSVDYCTCYRSWDNGVALGGTPRIEPRGRSSVVEPLLPKQAVEGSNPFARSKAKGADMEIRILGAADAKKLVFEEPGKWNVVSIFSPGQDHFDAAAEAHCADFQKLCFDDSWSEYDRSKGRAMPSRAHVRQAIEFAADKDKILVHCWAGVSRSSATAFVIACSHGVDPFEAAKTLLNPAIHAPNPLVVEFGAEILDDPRVIEAYRAFERIADMHHKHLWSME